MKGSHLILVCVAIFLLLPGLVLADCDDFGGFTSFVLQGTNTVVLYAGTTAIGQFDVQSCSVQANSTIRIVKNPVCDGDEVVIDGSNCTVMNVKSLD
jgi:hypothetical protein